MNIFNQNILSEGDFLNKATASQPLSAGKFILNCLIAALIGVTEILILCGICALILNSVQAPEKLYFVCAVIIYLLSSVIAGVASKRKNGHSALFCGVLSGALLIGILFALSLIFVNLEPQAPLWQLAVLPLGATVGAAAVK